MADIYINPNIGTGSGIGSELDPFASWDEVTEASDTNYYIVRGTTQLITARADFNNLSNIKIRPYGGGADPIIEFYKTLSNTGDFAEVFTNVWVYDSSVEFTRALFVLGLGELGDRNTSTWRNRVNFIARGGGRGPESFSVYGQWDTTDGAAAINIATITEGNPTIIALASAGDNASGDDSPVLIAGNTGNVDINGYHIATWTANDTFTIDVDTSGGLQNNDGALNRSAKLYIYSDDNPITKWGNTYYITSQDPIFQIRGTSANISIKGIATKYGYAVEIIRDTSDGIEIIRVTGEHCRQHLRIVGSPTNCRIVDPVCYRAGEQAYYLTGTPGAGNRLIRPQAYDLGGSDFIGGIYCPNCNAASSFLISRPLIQRINRDPYWPGECYSLYTDGSSNNVIFKGGYLSDSEIGFLHTFNNPQDVYFIGIIGDTANMGSWQQITTNGSSTNIYNCTFKNVFIGSRYSKTTDAMNFTALDKNNIYISNGDTGSIGLLVNDPIDDSTGATLVEDYNIFSGFDTNKQRADEGALIIPFGANNFTADPLLDSNYEPASNSPAIRSGINISVTVLTDSQGRLLPIVPDRGAGGRYSRRKADIGL